MNSHWNEDIVYIGRVNHRTTCTRFGIKTRDRRSHVYVIGKTGTGKSTLLRSMILQDIRTGRGMALLDPHGDLVEDILSLVPVSRRDDVTYLDTPAENWTFNPLARIPSGRESLATAELVEVFKKIWADDWGPRLEHLLRNVVFTLLEIPSASLGDIPRLLTDRDYRERIAEGLSNVEVREYWLTEYARYSPPFRAVVVAPLQNKLGAMLTDPRLRSILTAEESSFDLEALMDGRKILLVNLSRGRIGEGPAAILGSLLVAHIGLIGLARADRPEADRTDFFTYLDEFQMFATESLATMLAELRKYRVSLVLSNQYLSQLDPTIRDAVLGNVGTLISFRVSGKDAHHLATEFAPVFRPVDLVGLPNFNIYMRLMIDGEVSRPFSAKTIPPEEENWQEPSGDAGGDNHA